MQRFAAACVRVVHRALVVCGQHVLDVLHGDLSFRSHAERDVVAAGREVRVRTVPEVGAAVEIALDVPGAGRVVDVIRVAVGTESLPRVEGISLEGQVEVVVRDELLQVGARHVFLLFAQRVVQVEFVQIEVIRAHGVAVVRHAAGDPVMAAYGLEPPDLIEIGERDAVHFVGAVGLQQHAQPLYAFPGAADIGEHEGHDILFADASLFEGVAGKDTFVGRQGLGRGHGYACGIDPRSGPVAFRRIRIRHGGVAHGIVRQIDLHLRDDGNVLSGLFLGLDDDKLLRGKAGAAGILVPRNHRGPVERRFFTY